MKPLKLHRSWLLAGSAVVAGVVGSTYFMPASAAQQLGSSCINNNPNFYICAGSESTAIELDPTVNNFSVTFGVTTPVDEAYTWTGSQSTAVTITNGHGPFDGTIGMNDESSIINQTGNGMVVNGQGAVTLNVEGDIIGGAGAFYGASGATSGNYEPGDALRVTRWAGDTTINVGSSEDGGEQVVGADDGIVVVSTGSSGHTLYVNNYGLVAGKGLAGSGATGDTSNDSEGIHVSRSGTFGSDIEGSVEIYNAGLIFGSPNVAGGAHTGGQGISISATDGIYVDNYATEDYSITAATILGADGVKLTNNHSASDGDIVVDNAAYKTHYYYDDYHSGGLILGYVNNGVDIETSTGNVEIWNQGTRDQSISVATVVGDIEGASALEGNPLLNGFAGVGTRGIWGVNDGVYVSDVEGSLNIYNGGTGLNVSTFSEDANSEDVGGGTIVGINGDAVHVSGFSESIGGDPTIDNTNGLMWGGEDGVHFWNTNLTLGDHQLNVENEGGNIFGTEDGVHIAQTIGGNIYIDNGNGGTIEGFYGDAIHIWNVQTGLDGESVVGGDVTVDNGALNASEDYVGGTILSADTAVFIHDVEHATIYNSAEGSILGDGSYDEPVIDLNTNDVEGVHAAQVYNWGLMSSTDIPGFVRDTNSEEYQQWDAPDPTYLPTIDTNYAGAMADAAAFGTFAWTGGQSGRIDAPDDGTYALSDYAQAAQDRLIVADGGTTYVENFNLMIGRITATGETNNNNTEDYFGGNVVNNRGTWLVTDHYYDGETYGNNLGSDIGENASIYFNSGLIQSAFDPESVESVQFYGDVFVNGGFINGNDSNQEDAVNYQNGLVSVIDGGTGDSMVFYTEEFGAWGTDATFESAANVTPATSTSFFGLDVNFTGGPAAEDPTEGVFSTDSEDWRSDRFGIAGGYEGSTGLIIHKAGSGTTMVGDTILVGNVYGQVNNNEDSGKDSAFFIASQSQGYENVGGRGAIGDGLYAWYLDNTPATGDDGGGTNYYLESDWGPQAVQMAGLMTGASNIWFDTGSDVNDQVGDGKKQPAGADLAVGEAPPPTVDPSGAKVWGKVTGDLFRRSTSVTETLAGVPTVIDTSLVQSTFSALVGADYTTTMGDNTIRGGIFGGAISSGLSFTSYGASATYTGGTIGAYAAVNNGGFFGNIEGKADILGITYNAPFGGGFTTTGLSTAVGVSGNAGYRIDTGGMYIEPTASLAVVDTMLSGGTVSGNDITVRGGLGATIGTTVATSYDTTTDLSLTGKVWDQMTPGSTVTVTDGVNSETFTDSPLGLFGELTGTASITSTDKTLSGYGSAGVKFNGNFVTVQAKAGIQKSF